MVESSPVDVERLEKIFIELTKVLDKKDAKVMSAAVSAYSYFYCVVPITVYCILMIHVHVQCIILINMMPYF